MKRVWVCFCVMAMAWTLTVAGSSRPKISFRVHVQTSGNDFSNKQAFPVQLMRPMETVTLNAIPELTEADIVHIDSWPSDDQNQGLAVKLQFNPHGVNALSNMTIQDEGRVMVVFINGRVVYAPLIDTVLNNGQLTIPRGVLPDEVKAIELLATKNNKN